MHEGSRQIERGTSARYGEPSVGRHIVHPGTGHTDSPEPYTDYFLYRHRGSGDGNCLSVPLDKREIFWQTNARRGCAAGGRGAGAGVQHTPPAGERGVYAVHHARRQRNHRHPAGPVWRGCAAQQQLEREWLGHQLCLWLELRHRRDLHPASAGSQRRRQHRARGQEQRFVQQFPPREDAPLLGRPAVYERPCLFRSHRGVSIPLWYADREGTRAVVDTGGDGGGHPPVVG